MAESAKTRWTAVFDRAAAAYDRREPRFLTEVANRLVRHAGVSAGDRVLDVCTGPAVVLLQAAGLAGSGAALVGVDLSRAMVEEARRRLREAGVTGAVVRVDAECLGLAGAGFDAALCSCGWFAPGELLRVLRPGGRCGVALFGDTDERWAWKNELLLQLGPPLDPLDLDRPSTAAGLAARLEAAGFRGVTACGSTCRSGT